MKCIDNLIAKLQAYKALSDSNARAIGEHLFPLAKEIELAFDIQEMRIKSQCEMNYMNNIIKAAEENTETTYEYNGNTYIMSVKKEKNKLK